MPYSHISGDSHRHLDPSGNNHIKHEHPDGDSEHADHVGMFPGQVVSRAELLAAVLQNYYGQHDTGDPSEFSISDVVSALEGALDDASGDQSAEPVVTAFLVYQTPEGIWAAHPDINKALQLQRQAHLGDYTAAAAVISRDVAAMEMINRNMQHAMSMAEQMKNAQMAQGLGIGQPRPGMPPGGNRRLGGPERPLG